MTYKLHNPRILRSMWDKTHFNIETKSLFIFWREIVYIDYKENKKSVNRKRLRSGLEGSEKFRRSFVCEL
jgi:hypothetical protein